MILRQAQDRPFGEAAAQLFGVAASLLGWRPDEFWAATPAELAGAFMPSGSSFEPVDSDRIVELRQRFPDQ